MSKTITITGKVVYKDKSPVKGAKIKIWETDSLQKNNPDDLIVNDTTDDKGNFRGSGKWKDSTIEIGTYRYEVSLNGKLKKGGNITNPHNFFEELKTGWLSPKEEKEEIEKASVTITGNVLFDDRSPISGAIVKIWETDNFKSNNADDLIVNDTSDKNGYFSGTGIAKDTKLEITPTYRYEVKYKGQVKTGGNITNPHSFFRELKTPFLSPIQEKAAAENAKVTIAGRVLFDDKSPISGAKIKIWETDNFKKNNADDLIVNDTTDQEGSFIGTGIAKDTKLEIQATYRYEVTYKGQEKTGGNIMNPHSFFKELRTPFLSPAQEKEQAQKEMITISGKVVYKDKTPIKGARVQIWETDNFSKNNPDDLIVDDITNAKGEYSGSGRGKDVKLEIAQTFRYRISIPGTDLVEESKLTELPKSHLNVIKTSWSSTRVWKNWLNDFATTTQDDHYFFPKNRKELEGILQTAVEDNLRVKVVGSGHSHSRAAQPMQNNLIIDMKFLSGSLDLYDWKKPDNKISLLNEKTHKLVRVKAGTQLRTLNRKILAPKKLGLINQGTFDGQTVAGAINTNTHGNGISLPGFADMVRSVEMYVIKPQSKGTHKVECWVIEPKNGISDPLKFKKVAENKFLIQNDEVFHSVVCGYGLFGAAFSYTLEVRDTYWLEEAYEYKTWKQVEKMLENTKSGIPVFLTQHDQVKLYVHTAQGIKDGSLHDEVHCKLETLDEVPVIDKPDAWDNHLKVHKLWPPMRSRTFAWVGTLVSGTFFKIKGPKKDGKPSLATVSALTHGFFKAQKGNHFYGQNNNKKWPDASVYYRAIRRNRDNSLEYDPTLKNNKIDNTRFSGDPETSDFAITTEICVPVADTARALKKTIRFLSKAGVNFVTPTGIRFTKESPHYLAPAYEIASTFIEISGWLPNNREKAWGEFFDEYNAALSKLVDHLREELDLVRFHMGKFNTYTYVSLRSDFPKFDTWAKYYHLFNASGLFDCPNSTRWKLNEFGAKPSLNEAGIQMDALKS